MIPVGENTMLLVAWTDTMSEKQIEDFIYVKNKVFGSITSKEEFIYQYVDNIYGDSLVAIVYHKKEPVSIQGFWRNDLDGCIAFQSVDSATVKNERKNAYYLDTVMESLNIIRGKYQNAIVYGFPNVSNTLPLGLLMGWSDIAQYYYCIYTGFDEDMRNMVPKIDVEYAKYWLLTRKHGKILKVKIQGRYYLTHKVRKHIYFILGEVREDVAKYVKNNKWFDLLLYKSKNKGSFSKYANVNHILIYNFSGDENNTKINIPLYKVDAL